MTTFLLSLLVFLLAVAAMAVGVLSGGRSLRGSCGGLGAGAGDEGRPLCDACGAAPDEGDCPLERLERAAPGGTERH